jgi:hypothetical protein
MTENNLLTQLIEDHNESFSEVTPNLSTYRKQSSSYSNDSECQSSIEERQEEGKELQDEERGREEEPSHVISRRSVRSKSSFCPKSTFFRPTFQ